MPKEPKPRAPRKPAAEGKSLAARVLKDPGAPGLAGTKRKKKYDGKMDTVGEDKGEKQIDCPQGEMAESGPSVRMKEEVRLEAILVRVYVLLYTLAYERRLNGVASIIINNCYDNLLLVYG